MAAIGAGIVAQQIGCCCFKLLSKWCSSNKRKNVIEEEPEIEQDEVDHGVHVSNNFNVTCCGSRGMNNNQDTAYFKNGESGKITIPTQPSKVNSQPLNPSKETTV